MNVGVNSCVLCVGAHSCVLLCVGECRCKKLCVGAHSYVLLCVGECRYE